MNEKEKDEKIKDMLENGFIFDPANMSFSRTLGFSEVHYFGKAKVPFFEIIEKSDCDNTNVTLTVNEANKLAEFINKMVGDKK
jgi:hypothetical protein